MGGGGSEFGDGGDEVGGLGKQGWMEAGLVGCGKWEEGRSRELES